jgi:hypothetical protein
MAQKDGLRLELALFEEMLLSEGYKEGLRALANERKPGYKGRLTTKDRTDDNQKLFEEPERFLVDK